MVEQQEKQFPHIVGIGASAGGLEAIQTFFDHMPVDSNMAFVVVQHLSPDFDSLMHELLKRNTSMAVYQAEHRMQIAANSIYLIPPGRNIWVEQGTLVVAEQTSPHYDNMPVDILFRSLAQEYHCQAIGIVLSGTGSDGSDGISHIYEANGLVLVQNPETAKFNGMPNSALTTGKVTCCLDVAAMPRALLDYQNNYQTFLQHYVEAGEEGGDSSPLENILLMLHTRYQIDFSLYKSSTILRRIQNRISALGLNDMQAYAENLAGNADEQKQLYRELLIGVTDFFRDNEAFDFIYEKVLPTLCAQKDEELRIWVTATATGQEAYSLAMLFRDYLDTHGGQQKVRIFATDISQHFLATAMQAIYSNDQVGNVPAAYIDKYFTELSGQRYQVVPEIRNMVLFVNHNLINDPPFTRMDLVCCRNFMIYIQPQVQDRILHGLHFGLNKEGFLLVGPNESIGDIESDYELMSSRWKVFKKVRHSKHSRNILQWASTSRGTGSSAVASGNNQPARESISSTETQQRRLPLHAYDQLLDHVIDRGILINSQREILHVFGDANAYLSFPKGRPSSDLVAMVDASLQSLLVTGLNKASRNLETVQYELNSQGGDDREASAPGITLCIVPLADSDNRVEYFLVQFNNVDDAHSESRSVVQYADGESQSIVEDLKHELEQTRQTLQSTIEETENTNEELQSTNQELLASNEELQSTNEELQSTNEELYSVNAQYQKKIQEVNQARADIDNILQTSNMGTVVVDEELNIRLFTRAATELLHIVEQDIGRSLSHFISNFAVSNLIDQIHTVMERREAYEQETQSANGAWYVLTIYPYIDQEQQVKGAILTIVDVTVAKRSEQRYFKTLQSLPVSVLITDKAGNLQFCNENLVKISGYSEEALLAMNIEKLVPERYHSQVHQYLQQDSSRMTEGNIAAGRNLALLTRDGQEVPVEHTFTLMEADNGDEQVLCSVVDVSQIREAEKILRQNNVRLEKEVDVRKQAQHASEEKYARLYNQSPDLYATLDHDSGTITMCNTTLASDLGYEDRNDIIGCSLQKLLPRQDKEIAEILLGNHAREDLIHKEHHLLCQDGSLLPVSLRVKDHYAENGQLRESFISWSDLSKTRALEAMTRRLHTSEQLFRDNQQLYDTILNSVTDGWWDWNLENNRVSFSTKFKEALGYDDQELAGANPFQNLILEKDYQALMTVYKRHIESEGSEPLIQEVRYRHKDGSIVWGIFRGCAIKDNDNCFRRMVGTHTDITQLKQIEARMHKQAYIDGLTGLPNRASFMNALQLFIEHAAKNGKKFAVMFIDLDNFKQINDSFGHYIGDYVLSRIATRLKKVLRSNDFVARIGGDEMAALIDDFHDTEEVDVIAERCLYAVEKPVQVTPQTIKQSASLGISLYPASAMDDDSLLQYADTAMYRAKEKGKNNYIFFQPELDDKLQHRNKIEIALREPVEKNNFKLAYQPQFDTQQGRLIGLEALLRWESEELGNPRPDEFIPLAEHNQRIIPLGRWLLDKAVEEFRYFQKITCYEDIKLSVNFSMVQFNDHEIVETIKNTLKRHNIAPAQLCVEVTETGLMERVDSVQQILCELDRMGVSIAIDDFGTGYSSLYYLMQLPLSYLKIDKAFVHNFHNRTNSAIIKTIIGLGRSLAMHSIAEGVEDQKQLEFVRSVGCDGVQGFYFDNPLYLLDLIQQYQ